MTPPAVPYRRLPVLVLRIRRFQVVTVRAVVVFVDALSGRMVDDGLIAEGATVLPHGVQWTGAAVVTSLVARLAYAVLAVFTGGALRHAYVPVLEVLAAGAVARRRAVARRGALFVATFALIVLGAVKSVKKESVIKAVKCLRFQ